MESKKSSPFFRDRIDDLAVFELKAHVRHFASFMDGGEAEGDDAVDGIQHRPGEDFAVGEILVPVAVDPLSALDAHTNVGAVGRNHAVLALAVEEIRQPLLALPDLFPRGNRIFKMQQPRVKDKILILRQRHLRILRARLSRILRAAPLELSLRSAAQKRLHNRLARGRRHAHLLGIAVAQRLGVLFTPDADGAVDPFDLE
jgi:hypothetical protein